MRPINYLLVSLLSLTPACVGEVSEYNPGDDEADAAPGAPDADPAAPDAAPPALSYDVTGSTKDYSNLDPLPNIALAAQGMTPPMQTESDATGAYTLAGVGAGNSFYFMAMPAGLIYVPTINPPIAVLDQNVLSDVHVVSLVYKDRQNATAGDPLVPLSSIVISNLMNLDGTPWVGVPLTGISLQPMGGGLPVGAGPYFIGVNGDVDKALLESVAFGARGARVAFLNVPTGSYEMHVTYTPVIGGPEISVIAGVTTVDSAATLALAIHDPALDGGGAATFTTDIYPILQKASKGGQDCASCHTAGGAGAVLIMDDGAAIVHARLLAKPGLIDLLAPELSLLLTKPLYEDPPNHPNATWLDITNPYYLKILLWIQGGAPL